MSPYQYPAITEDVLRAVRYVRYHADELGIDPDKIAVLGFSAGGHLAASALCGFDYGREDGDETDKVSSRPDAVILSYAVITLGKYTHADTRNNLIKGLPDEAELERRFSGELAVKRIRLPCFIWHTQNDDAVPVQNSLQLYNALCEKKIPRSYISFRSDRMDSVLLRLFPMWLGGRLFSEIGLSLPDLLNNS